MPELQSICLAIILLPLAAAILAGLFGKIIGRRGASSFTILAVGVSFVLSLLVFKGLAFDKVSNLDVTLYTWGKSGPFHFQIGFLIDRLSALMILIVSFISFMVHIYTVGYMQEDPGYQRFFSYISLFTFGMLVLVMSNNFLQLFFGWEMVGLMSYLLIGFWFQKETAIVANLKAFIVNRVGDFGFILGMAGVAYYFGTLDYSAVFERIDGFAVIHPSIALFPDIQISAITLICLCLFLGAMGKSAQIPLHVWLPDSMEGPTPISALIHAATMVTAGVFMIARLSPLFEYSEVALNTILVIGSLTCLLMGLVGVVQSDIKRIIAYSTLSQLGYMMTAMGASAYSIGMFHLTTHAFFKALLFLGAGSVIIALHHEQNIWKMGNLRKYMPITYLCMLIGSLALIGFPFFSGFYSKDLIIEAVQLSNLAAAKLAYPIVLGSVFITALYTFRLFFVVFHTKERMDKTNHHLKESAAVIWFPLVLLAIPSLVIGAMFVNPLFQNYFQDSLMIHANHASFSDLQQEFTGWLEMGLQGFLSAPFWLGIGGLFSAWIAYIAYPDLPRSLSIRMKTLHMILQEKLGFDRFNQWLFAGGARFLGWFCWRVGDEFLIDGLGVNGSADNIGRLSRVLRKFQSGYLYQYAFVMILGFLVLLWVSNLGV